MKLLTVLAVVVAALIGLAALTGTAGALLSQERTVRGVVTDPVRAVVLETDTGDVEVARGDGEVTFERRERYLFAEPDVRQQVVDGVLRISTDCDGPGPCTVDLALRVPEGTDVRARSDAGDVGVAGLRGRVRAESDAGDVSVRDLRTAELRVETDAGDVEATRVSGERLRLTTDAGDVRAVLTTAPRLLEARTDAGDVELAVPSTRYAVQTDTDAGDVTVQGVVRDDTAPRRITATTSAGDVLLAAR
jgi:hypothetical protein